jgi:hypothetical protein
MKILSRLIWCMFLSTVSTTLTMGQDSRNDVTFSGPIIFAELYGVGGAVTVNLEHKVFDIGRHLVAVRVGYGKHKYFGNPYRQVRSIPIGVGFIRGKRNHHREIGAGLTYAEGNENDVGFGWLNKSVFLVPFVGYRYQRPGGGLFLKAQLTPMVKIKEYSESRIYRSQVGELVFSAGISLGYYLAHDWRSR